MKKQLMVLGLAGMLTVPALGDMIGRFDRTIDLNNDNLNDKVAMLKDRATVNGARIDRYTLYIAFTDKKLEGTLFKKPKEIIRLYEEPHSLSVNDETGNGYKDIMIYYPDINKIIYLKNNGNETFTREDLQF